MRAVGITAFVLSAGVELICWETEGMGGRGRGRGREELEGGWGVRWEESVVGALGRTWEVLAVTWATLTEIGGVITRRPALARAWRALIRTWRAWVTTVETLSAA